MTHNAVNDKGRRLVETVEGRMKAYDCLPREVRAVLANAIIDWHVSTLPRLVKSEGVRAVVRHLIVCDTAEAARYSVEAATGKPVRSLTRLLQNLPDYAREARMRQDLLLCAAADAAGNRS